MPKALLIDVSRCTGCRACQVACKQWNDLSGERAASLGCYGSPLDLSASTWNRIAFKEIERENGRLDWVFRSVRCMHCTDAPCVRVCPTGALYKHSLGFTAYDVSKCNGCGYCTQFCPFVIPRLKGADVWGGGEIAKCNFCHDRVTAGLAPACAKACPTGAIEYEERDELIARGKARVEALKEQGYSESNLYGDDILGGLGVMYVLTDRPDVFDLPEHPRATLAEAWQPWIQTLGAIAVGATAIGLLINWRVARTRIKAEET